MRRLDTFEEVLLGVNDFDEPIFDAAPDCETLPDSEDIIAKALGGIERLPSEVTPHPDTLVEKRAGSRLERVGNGIWRKTYDAAGNEISGYFVREAGPEDEDEGEGDDEE